MKKITINTCTPITGAITDRVKTFEDACATLGFTNPVANFEFADQLEKHAQAIVDHTKLIVVTEALNEGWQPNWNDSNEPKYYIWFNLENGFSLHRVRYDCRPSIVSSRLCFKTKALAEHAAKHFLGLYKSYFTYNTDCNGKN